MVATSASNGTQSGPRLRCWGAGVAAGTAEGHNTYAVLWSALGSEYLTYLELSMPPFRKYYPFDAAVDVEDGGELDVVASFAVGDTTSAAIYADGSTRMFGMNVGGGLGKGFKEVPSDTTLSTPLENGPLLANLTDPSEVFVSFSSGGQFFSTLWNFLRGSCVCGLTNAGVLRCWGSATFCTLAPPGTKEPLYIPSVPVVAGAASQQNVGSGRWTKIFDYSVNCCFGPADTGLTCFGAQVGPGPLGNDTRQASSTDPVHWPLHSRVVSVHTDTAYGSICALTEDRSFVCIGRALGYYPWEQCVNLIDQDPVTSVNTQGGYMRQPCVLLNGSANPGYRTLPKDAALVGLAAQPSQWFALLDNGEARSQGSLEASGTQETVSVVWHPFAMELPLDLSQVTPAADLASHAASSHVLSVAMGDRAVCAVTADQTVSCWGRNDGVAIR